MVKISSPQLQVDEVTRSILLAWERQCALRDKGGGRPRNDTAAGSDFLQLKPFEVEPEIIARQNGCAIDDLTRFHDRDFVNNAYRALLGREPDSEGCTHYLTQLRTGKMTKVEILARLRYSPEGRAKSVNISKLTGVFLLESILGLQVIGYIVQLFVALFQCPSLPLKFLATLKPPRAGCEKPDKLCLPQANGGDCDR
jgi:hypothetical protein